MKAKTCKICRVKFAPSRPMQVVCSPQCASAYAWREKTKAEVVVAREDRKAVRLKLEKLKTPHQKRAKLIQAAEKEVRDYKRLSELKNGSGCISCGRSQQEVIGTEGWKPGGAFDAGHYHGKGARPNLRLEPDNIWLQCKSCNSGSANYAKKAATVSKQFKENLIARIGLSRVEELDADDNARHWSDEELIEIASTYKQKVKELKGG